MIKNVRKNRIIISLVLVCIVQILIISVWIFNNSTFEYAPHTAVHAEKAVWFFKNVFVLKNISLHEYFFAETYSPQLHYFLTALFLALFPSSTLTMMIPNSLYLFIYVLSIYGIVLTITGRRSASFTAAICAMSFPGVLLFLKSYHVHLGVIASVSAAVYCMMRSDYFKKSGYGILCVLAVCCALYMERLTPVLFIVGPLLYSGCGAIRTAVRNRDRTHAALIVGYVMLAVIILAPFYVTWVRLYLLNGENFMTLFSNGNTSCLQSFTQYIHTFSVKSLKNMLFYVIMMPQFHLGVVWTCVAVLAIVHLIRTKSSIGNMLLLWVVIPMLFFTLLPKKDVEYMAALAPACAVIIGCAVAAIRHEYMRKAITGILIAFGVLHSYGFIFNATVAQSLITHVTFYDMDSIINSRYLISNRRDSKINRFIRLTADTIVRMRGIESGIVLQNKTLHKIDMNADIKMGIILGLKNPEGTYYTGEWFTMNDLTSVGVIEHMIALSWNDVTNGGQNGIDVNDLYFPAQFDRKTLLPFSAFGRNVARWNDSQLPMQVALYSSNR